MPYMGRPVYPFIVEREGWLQQRERREKEGKEEREKQKDGVVYGLVPLLLLMAPLVVRGMETCVIPGSCSSLEQRAFPVNPDEAPHHVTGVGGVK
jgi:hypothetical protein